VRRGIAEKRFDEVPQVVGQQNGAMDRQRYCVQTESVYAVIMRVLLRALSKTMDPFRLFLHWLWDRPSTRDGRIRLPFPRLISHLFVFVCFVALSYVVLTPFVHGRDRQVLQSLFQNIWVIFGMGLFFCAIITNTYLEERFPSARKGFLAQFSPGKRDFGDPVVRFQAVIGLLCLVMLAVGFFKIFGKAL
jgi:hypothetical protein